MRIVPGLHLVASGATGFSLTDALDCNTWLIETAEGLAMFDTGAGRDVPAVLAEVRRDGLDPGRLRHVFLTHAHADHSGGAAGLLESVPGPVTLHAGWEAAERMASGDEARISLDRARALGVYPPDYRWRGVDVGHVMRDDEDIRVGEATIRLISSPGHSADHVSFLVRLPERTLLISGDAVLPGGKIIIQDIPDCDIPASLASIRRLAALEFDSFLPGHGLFSLKDGTSHVRRARAYADTGLAPPSFF